MAYYKIKDSKGVYDIYQFKNEAEARSKLYPGEQIVGLVREADAIANKYTAKDMPHMKTLSEARKEAKYETGAGWNERRYKAAKEATKDEKGSTAKRAMKQLAPRLVESAERQDLGEDVSTLQDLKKGQQDIWSLPGRFLTQGFSDKGMEETEGVLRDPTLFATLLSAGALTPMVAGAYAPSALATGFGSLLPMAVAGATTEAGVSKLINETIGDSDYGMDNSALDILGGATSAGWKGNIARNAVKGMFKDGIDPKDIITRYKNPSEDIAGSDWVIPEVYNTVKNAGKELVRDQVSPTSKLFDGLSYRKARLESNPKEYINDVINKGKPYQNQLDAIVNENERIAMKPQEIFPQSIKDDVMSKMSTDEQSRYAGDIFNNVEKLLIDRANIPGRETTFSTAMMGPLFKDVIDNTQRPIPKYGDLFPIGDAQSSAIRSEMNDVVNEAIKAKRLELERGAPQLLENKLMTENILGMFDKSKFKPNYVPNQISKDLPLAIQLKSHLQNIPSKLIKGIPSSKNRPPIGFGKTPNFDSRTNAIEAQLLGRLKEMDRENLLSYLTKTDAKRLGANTIDLLLGTGQRTAGEFYNFEQDK